MDADETDWMSERFWRRLAAWASRREAFTAGRYVAAGGRVDDLPDLLGCPPAIAWRVALCLPPASAADADHWAQRVSGRWRLDPGRVRALALLIAPDDP